VTFVSARAAVVTAALVALLPLAEPGRAAAPDDAAPRMVAIKAGSYVPLNRAPAREAKGGPPRSPSRRRVPAFDMDEFPVTNGEFLEFVRAHPEWRRSRAKAIFVDRSYLRHWQGDLELGPRAPTTSPVVNVSWFAARAYLKAHGRDLPTVDQWEYVAAASETAADASRDRAFLDRLRMWYGRPTLDPLPPIGSTVRNIHGLSDLHGLIWEWTLDFNSALVTGESRADAALERTLYCGSGAIGAADFEDYAAFMRYAFRSSLEAHYSVANLGFRGVRNRTEKSR
jgi:formylglycine-generating enzyme